MRGKGAISPAMRSLEINTSGKRHFVRHKDIIHAEAEGSYTPLYLASGKRFPLSKNLKRVEGILTPDMFYRTHNSHLVQLERVVSRNFRDNSVQRDSGAKVPMAVRKRESLKQKWALVMPA